MKSNKEVVLAFSRGESAKSGSMTSTGYRLFSYNTIIAEYTAFGIRFNASKYSATTSKHQSLCKRHLNIWKHTNQYVPINTQDHLIDYCEKQ
jgi:hypothetical protein